MVKVSLPIKLTIFLSLSLTASSSPLFFKAKPKPKATPSDLLAVLGPTSQSSSVNPRIAQQLNSCFKFLVPFKPPSNSIRRSLRSRDTQQTHQDNLIWWPPAPILDLARLAFDSGGDPDAIYTSIDPTPLPVPDVEGCKKDKCELTRTPYGRQFISQDLNLYIEFLFQFIVSRGPSVGLNVSLNRYDLFHGHIFIAAGSARLGILFHAREYPACDKDVFPYNMGYCQIGSNVMYDDSMNLRNILWLAPLPNKSTKGWESPGVLVVLDARPDGIIYRDIIPEYVNFARTIYEDDLGVVVADVNYLNVGGKVPDYQIFIC